MSRTVIKRLRIIVDTVTGFAGLAAIAIAQVMRDMVQGKETQRDPSSQVPRPHDAGRAY